MRVRGVREKDTSRVQEERNLHSERFVEEKRR